MKYIPIERFEAINSLLSAVEYEPGSCLTIRLEAFTCRQTKEEKQIANQLAEYMTKIQRTPPVSPSLGVLQMSPSEHALEMPSTPVLLLGSTTAEETFDDDGLLVTSRSSTFTLPSAAYVDSTDVDERLIYCVAALNNIYRAEGYDFNVLTGADFVSHSAENVKGEVNLCLQHLPVSCSPAISDFWPSVKDVAGSSEEGCEFFEFSCPSCDPLAEDSLYSHTYFLFNKRKKIIVSLILSAKKLEDSEK